MKILLATDGSPCSDAVVKEFCARPWPAGSEVRVLSAAYITVPLEAGIAVQVRLQAAQAVERAAKAIRAALPGMRVETKVCDGTPRYVILDEADEWGADLILVGSQGLGALDRFLLGSVSHSVALHAHCSVEIVRRRPTQIRSAPA